MNPINLVEKLNFGVGWTLFQRAIARKLLNRSLQNLNMDQRLIKVDTSEGFRSSNSYSLIPNKFFHVVLVSDGQIRL